MASTPKATPAKAKTNAPNAKPAQAKNVATPPENETPKPEEKPAPDAAPPDNAGNSGPDLTEQQQGGGTDEALVFSAEDLAEFKRVAYSDGFSAGFSEALDNMSDGAPDNPEGGEAEEGPVPPEDEFQTTASDFDQDLLGLIALGMMIPENQRKGGLRFAVDRMGTFIDGLPMQDRYPALVMMRTIAETRPADLNTGKYENLVREGLGIFNGQAPDTSHRRDEYDPTKAAERLESQGMPEETEVEEDADLSLDPNVDQGDATAAASAAARLSSAI